MKHGIICISLLILASCSTNFGTDGFDAATDPGSEVHLDTGIDPVDDTGLDPVDDVVPDTIDDVVTDTIEDTGVDSPPVYHTLTVNAVGDGTVTSSPPGIDCGSDCTEDFLDGTAVTLTAAAGTGGTFTGWSGGGCTGTGTCVVTMTAATTVSANFTLDRHVLTVTPAGSGSGTVTSTPSGISCPTDCSEDYAFDTVVTLSAAADTGSTFTGWSGACSGTGSCVVTMTAAMAVTATYTLDTHVLDVTRSGTGTGTVTSTPSGISCGTDCTETYDHGATVSLSASAGTGSTFGGWSGACSGTGTCVVTMTTARSVTATFTLDRHVLTVTRTGTGSGTVNSSPSGISCGTDCSETYGHGTSVTLSASASTGSYFAGWSGGGCSGTGSCVVSMTAARTVTATFTANRYLLTVTHSGSGSGTVTSSPPGITCGTDCSEYYDHGTVVTLTATPGSGDMFTGWSGGGCSGTGTCIRTHTSAVTITATFEPAVYNYAFISPVPTTAAMGGLTGADTLCRGWAASAGIGGTYRAILSTATTNASTRLGSARGWVRPDGRPVGDLPSDIFSTSSGLLIPLMITADGTNVGVKSVWSASTNSGIYNTSASGTDCSGWTSASTSIMAWYGFSNTTSEWLSRGTRDYCDSLFHIYCFQVDHTTPLDTDDFAESGRIIFVSTGDFNTGSSIAGADALCTADAATYSALSGRTFQAFLANIGTTAASRFSSSSDPIVRVDGLRVANNFLALTTSDLIHPPNIKANGTNETWRVFVGANSPTSGGTATSTCAGWSTSTIGNVTEGFAYSSTVLSGDRRWFGNTSGSCSGHSGSVPVYCLEI